jgi:predicted nucleic acid-binding protein
MTGVRLLVDTSVWSRVARSPEVRSAFVARLAVSTAFRCPVVDLELLHSAQTPAAYDQWATTRAAAYDTLPLTPEVGERALHVQRELAQRGLHRAAQLPDLLIAAVAEIHTATVLHYDADYDHIAGVTGQPTDWIVPRGTVD